MDRNRAIHFAATAHQTTKCELNLSIVALCREARKNLRRPIVPIVDEMVETDEIVARQSHFTTTRRSSS
jgi:hypothetical protein